MALHAAFAALVPCGGIGHGLAGLVRDFDLATPCDMVWHGGAFCDLSGDFCAVGLVGALVVTLGGRAYLPDSSLGFCGAGGCVGRVGVVAHLVLVGLSVGAVSAQSVGATSGAADRSMVGRIWAVVFVGHF